MFVISSSFSFSSVYGCIIRFLLSLSLSLSPSLCVPCFSLSHRYLSLKISHSIIFSFLFFFFFPSLSLSLSPLTLSFQIKKGSGDEGSARNDLLEWVRSKIPEYDIKNFQK